MVCKGICHRYKAKWMTQTARYGNGQKRCNICELFMSWDGSFCPCCGHCCSALLPVYSGMRQHLFWTDFQRQYLHLDS